MFDSFMQRKKLILAFVVGGFLALSVSGIGLWLLIPQLAPSSGAQTSSFPTPHPDLVLALPPTLGELSLQYPQLETILNDKSLGSVYKDFIVVYEEGGLEAARALGQQRGMLNEYDEIRMTLLIDSPDNTAAVAAEIMQSGIRVISSSEDEINILLPLTVLEQMVAIGQEPDALFIQLTQIEHIIRIKLPIPRQSQEVLLQQNTQGEGVEVTGANLWHQAGFTGEGIKIGILDLGFAGYRNLLGNELPAQVTAKAFLSYSDQIDDTDDPHGTACAEIVHEMAPDAELYLVMFDGQDDVSLQNAIDWLLAQGVQIISYSVGTTYGPKDGSGWDAQLVNSVADQGVLWVSAAGNEADSHFRQTFNDSDNNNIHEFPDGHEVMAIRPYDSNFSVMLLWDDWQAANQDYELILYDASFNVVASSTEPQDGSAGAEPIEYIYYEEMKLDNVYYIAIEAYKKTRDVTFDIFITPAELAFTTAEHSLNAPADARGALTVGATEWDDDSLAYYSSQGPTDDGRTKPDISAPTTVSGASYGQFGFDGTSAATPHVAGAAALIWSAHPEYSREDVVLMLENNALDYGVSGPDSAFGYGRLLLPNPGSSVVSGGDPTPTLGGDGDISAVTPTPIIPTSAPSSLLPTTTPQSQISPVPPSSAPTGRTSSPNLIAFAVLCLVAGMCCGSIVLIIGGVLFLLSKQRKTMPAAVSKGGPSVTFSGRRYKIPATGLSIGRQDDNQIVINDTKISRHHARIAFTQGRWSLQDLGSANGSYVNGQRINEQILQDGDQISLGGNTFEFHGG